jgi:hypothetical protein
MEFYNTAWNDCGRGAYFPASYVEGQVPSQPTNANRRYGGLYSSYFKELWNYKRKHPAYGNSRLPLYRSRIYRHVTPYNQGG